MRPPTERPFTNPGKCLKVLDRFRVVLVGEFIWDPVASGLRRTEREGSPHILLLSRFHVVLLHAIIMATLRGVKIRSARALGRLAGLHGASDQTIRTELSLLRRDLALRLGINVFTGDLGGGLGIAEGVLRRVHSSEVGLEPWFDSCVGVTPRLPLPGFVDIGPQELIGRDEKGDD